MRNYEIKDWRIVEIRKPIGVGDVRFEAFSVIHSLRAPTVSYRIINGRVAIFYVPDVVDVEDRA